jgi:hypothetical protein
VQAVSKSPKQANKAGMLVVLSWRLTGFMVSSILVPLLDRISLLVSADRQQVHGITLSARDDAPASRVIVCVPGTRSVHPQTMRRHCVLQPRVASGEQPWARRIGL